MHQNHIKLINHMPIIDFHGKKAITNYEPPFHILEEVPSLNYQSPITGNSQDNILIEGDNLLALKSLLPEYEGKIKCIYIDPPYNTNNKDWVYCDNIEITSKNDPAWKQVEKFLMDGNEVDYNDQSRHSKWLCMMYPRLKLLHKLLKDDGVIFVSIDKNEINHLVMIMCEIFGEDNLVSQITVQVNKGGRDYLAIAETHEYLVCFTKSNNSIIGQLEKSENNLNFDDSKGAYELRELRNPRFNRANRPNLFYPFYINPDSKNELGECLISLEKNLIFNIETLPRNSRNEDSCWRWGQEKSLQNIKKNIDLSQIVARQKRDGGWNIYEKSRKSTTKAKSIWDETEVRTEQGTIDLRELGLGKMFDHPKPTYLIQKCISLATNENDIILDSFSGSGTTANAVLNLNFDGGNRKFITIQLPEAIKEDKPAYIAGYKFVHEITRERIVRVAGGYTNSRGEQVDGLGGGFKYYRIGTPLFTKKGGDIVSTVTWEQLAPYLYFTEFRKPIEVGMKTKKPFVGKYSNMELFLIYKEPHTNILTEERANEITKLIGKGNKAVVYADNLELGMDEDELKEKGIIFKQIPYDVLSI
jgi:adenine-specific DNA-methyltransferase